MRNRKGKLTINWEYIYLLCIIMCKTDRAKKLGLNPPQEVKDVLDDTNKPCVFEL